MRLKVGNRVIHKDADLFIKFGRGLIYKIDGPVVPYHISWEKGYVGKHRGADLIKIQDPNDILKEIL